MPNLPKPLCLTFILSTFIFAFSCSNTSNKTHNKLIFNYNQSSGITSLDPAFARDQANIWAVHQMFNTLYDLDEKLNIRPSVAKSHSISDDGKTIRFVLREDVYFHNNQLFKNKEQRKLTSKDVIFSLNRLLDEKTASSGAWIFNNLVVGIEVPFKYISDTVFEIRLNQKSPLLISYLTNKYCSIVSKIAFEQMGKDNFSKHPIGSGPFQFFLREDSEALILHKNADYFEKDENNVNLPYLDAIKVSFIPDKQSEFLNLLSGKIDFISGVDASFRDQVFENNGSLKAEYQTKIQLISSPYLNTEYLGISMKGEEILAKSKEFRKALNFAIDRKAMLQFLRKNLGIAGTSGIIPPSLDGFDSTQFYHYSYNPEKAKELLLQSGYKKNMKITLQSNPSYADLCIYVKDQLRNIGVSVDVEILPPSSLRQLLKNGESPFFRASWIADYPDAENYLGLFYSKKHTPNGPNYTLFSNSEFDKLYEKSIQELNSETRKGYYKQMNAIIMEEAPVIVLFYDKVTRLVSNNISGMEANPINLLDLRHVKKKI